MAGINDINNRVAALGLAQAEKAVEQDKGLGQAEFFNLMVTQLTNQDPLEPLDSSEFLSQVAQFSQLSGIQDMSRSVDLLASSLQSTQALQASTLVGRHVTAPGNRLLLETPGETTGGAVVLPVPSGDVRVTIMTPSGEAVRSLELGASGAGDRRFQWDGLTANGAPAPAGTYIVRGDAAIDGTPVALETLVEAQVESVTLERNAGGMTLNLRGLGATNLNDVRQIF